MFNFIKGFPMKWISFFFAAHFLFFYFSYSQHSDASVIIHQNTLAGFLNAIGPISGKDKYDVLGSKGEYTWTLRNAHIDLRPNQAIFTADADIKVGLFSYSSKASGDVEVLYHPDSNRISVKVLHAVVEVYLKILGLKIHIADIDAAKFYKPEFQFAGPQPIQASVDITLPDESKKTIYIRPYAHDLKIEQEQIVVTSRLIFADRPISAINGTLQH
jgi:hypothetical protein